MCSNTSEREAKVYLEQNLVLTAVLKTKKDELVMVQIAQDSIEVKWKKPLVDQDVSC